MAAYKIGTRVKLIAASGNCHWQAGDTGVIEHFDPIKAVGKKHGVYVLIEALQSPCEIVQVRMDRSGPSTEHGPCPLYAHYHHVVPIDKPQAGSWEEMGFHPNDYLKEHEDVTN